MKQEIILATVLIVLVAALLNPFNFWMPGMLVYTLVVTLLLAFTAFAVFVWRERTRDEREDLHRLIAGRTSFLVGSGILVLGIIAQELQGKLDPWLAAALTGMVVAKMTALVYSRKKY